RKGSSARIIGEWQDGPDSRPDSSGSRNGAKKPTRCVGGVRVGKLKNPVRRSAVGKDRRPTRQVGGYLDNARAVRATGHTQLKGPIAHRGNDRQGEWRTERLAQVQPAGRDAFAGKIGRAH